MSNRQQFKCVDLIDKFNDTSRYFDDIFTIDNPEFAEHIPDIFPRELQLNMANPSDKETPFLDLNKVIGSNIHTSVYDKRGNFGFPIVIFPLLSGDVLRLPSYWIYISQLVRFTRCCTSFFDFHSKHTFFLYSNHFKTFGTGLQKSQASKNVWEVLWVILWTSVQILCYIVSGICITRNRSPGLLRWSCLQT